MSFLLTWNSHTHSPSIITVLYSLGPSIHMPGERMGREQGRIGILIRLIKNSRISFSLRFPKLLTGLVTINPIFVTFVTR